MVSFFKSKFNKILAKELYNLIIFPYIPFLKYWVLKKHGPLIQCHVVQYSHICLILKGMCKYPLRKVLANYTVLQYIVWHKWVNLNGKMLASMNGFCFVNYTADSNIGISLYILRFLNLELHPSTPYCYIFLNYNLTINPLPTGQFRTGWPFKKKYSQYL